MGKTRKDRWCRGRVTIYLNTGDRVTFKGGARTICDADDPKTCVDYELEDAPFCIWPRLDVITAITVVKP